MGVSNPVANRNIIKALYQRAVKFGDVPRTNEIKAWPFWMPFIPEPPQSDELAPFPQTQSCAGMGWPIAAGAFRDIPIETEQDAHYHLVNMKVTANRGPLTGEITVNANAVAVVGVGTLFTLELQVGDRIGVIDDGGEFRFAYVAAIANNLAMTLEGNIGPNAVTGASATGIPAGYRVVQWYQEQPQLSGGIQVNAAGAVTGVGTAFNTELQVGQNIFYVDDNGIHRSYPITNIAGALAMTLNLGAATGIATGAVNGTSYGIAPLPTPTYNRVRPLYTYLRASAFIKSSGSRYYLGGTSELSGAQTYVAPSLDAGLNAGGLQERPHAVRSLQGNHNGLAMMYTPVQIAKEGTLYVRVHNTHNLLTLFVNGAIFGYKVAV